MLLTMAWMTGCDSGKLEQSSGESTAAPVETTAESVADAPEETTGADGSGDNIQVFASSLDFEAAMAEQYPEVLLYEPPESFTAQWNLQQILLLADEKTPFYTQQFSREDAQAGTETVEIQVYFLNSYTSAEEGFQDFFLIIKRDFVDFFKLFLTFLLGFLNKFVNILYVYHNLP